MAARSPNRSRPFRTAPRRTAAARVEDHLRHVQRLVMQGELAAAAVHEISNLLTIVMFNAGLLRLRHREEPKVLKHVEPILHAADVMASLCTQLRNLSRPTPAQLRVLDLVETARRSHALLDQIMERELVLQTDGPEPVLIAGDPAHLDQIIVNLVLNARDATDAAGGRIRLRLGHVSATGAPYLEVSDNGVGLTPRVRRRIFKTFFTTKPPGQGTGLGLVTVRRLVLGMGGRIRLRSTPGQGTTIRLVFPPPSAADLAQPRAAALPAPAPISKP
jgi:signal transduction histidine kinase